MWVGVSVCGVLLACGKKGGMYYVIVICILLLRRNSGIQNGAEYCGGDLKLRVCGASRIPVCGVLLACGGKRSMYYIIVICILFEFCGVCGGEKPSAVP